MEIRGLYAIVDPNACPEILPEQLALDYLRGGVPILQLRDKGRKRSRRDYERFRQAASVIASYKKEHPFLFIINDDLEMALEVGADGIHVGKDDPSIEECRKSVEIVGYSSHSLEEALSAERGGASYVAFGAIFPSPTKGPGHPLQGIGRLREVVSTLKVPVVAIGGLSRDNIKDVLATGVASVAMISGLAKAPNRVEESRFYNRLFGS